MKTKTVLATLLAGAGLASASACKPKSAAAATPSSVTGAGGCTFDPNANLMDGQLDATTSNWSFNSGTEYACLFAITTCANGPLKDCIVYFFEPASYGEVSYDMWFSFYSTATTDGSTYTFQFDVSTNNLLNTLLSVFTSNTDDEISVTLNTDNTLQTVKLTLHAIGQTNLLINASPVDPSTIITMNNFGLYQTGCGQESADLSGGK
ncbi:hypothetical protein SEUCBS139899_009077 [Sporothrix eucalyptigena]